MLLVKIPFRNVNILFLFPLSYWCFISLFYLIPCSSCYLIIRKACILSFLSVNLLCIWKPRSKSFLEVCSTGLSASIECAWYDRRKRLLLECRYRSWRNLLLLLLIIIFFHVYYFGWEECCSYEIDVLVIPYFMDIYIWM